MKTLIWGSCISVVCLGFAANPASAVLPGLELTGGQTFFTPSPGISGWEFSTNRALQIDALGIFDSGSPGLSAGSYTLGIWDSSQNLLASTMVSGSGDGISNGFAWKSLASILSIAPGNYVVGASGSYATDQIAYNGTYTTSPGVTWLTGRFKLSSVFTYPTNSSTLTPSVFGGNFSEYKEPVPGPLPLAGAAAAFGWSRRLRKRVKVAASES